MKKNFCPIIDFNELMEGHAQNFDRIGTELESAGNYDSLLKSVAEIGKIGPTEKNANSNWESEDLTADLFANMSDSEMINYFLPVDGVDYNVPILDTINLKDSKKDKDEVKTILYSDEFLPHRMMPHLNPFYQRSPPPITNDNLQQKSEQEGNKVGYKNECLSDIDMEIESEEFNASNKRLSTSEKNEKNSSSSDEPRVIKKRKPRTYKYNPKPLQNKICRSFVPDDLKDIEYWARRKRNNEAAKKSREERRRKELEIMNSYEIMKKEYFQIKVENIRLKARTSILEKQVSDLQLKLKDCYH